MKEVEELVECTARELVIMVKRMSKYKAATFSAYKRQAKQILSHPDLYIRDNLNSRVDTEFIPLAEALKEVE